MAMTWQKTARLLMITSMLTTVTLISMNEAATVDTALLIKGDPAIGNCDLDKDCDYSKLSIESYDSYFKTDKSTRSSLGLNSKLLQFHQIAVGFVPALKEKIQPNSPDQINAKLPKPMSIMGDYITLSSWDPNLLAIDWHLPMVQKLEGNPVWCITLMPSEGAQYITEKVAEKIANKLAWVNQNGVVVWLKLMYEMNGNWNAWSGNPKLFVEKWNLVARAVKRVTNKTYMLWSPNAMFGKSEDAVLGGYTPYWPDPSTVDIVGISFYHWGKDYKRVNVAPTKAEAVDKLIKFAKIYGPDGYGKPVVVSETAACYTYYAGTQTPVEGGADESIIKLTWVHLLLDPYIKTLVPGLKAVIWFEIVKNENATGNTPTRTEDFRLVMGNPRLAEKVKRLFADYIDKEKAIIAPLRLD